MVLQRVCKGGILSIITALTLTAATATGHVGPTQPIPAEVGSDAQAIATAARTTVYQSDPPVGGPVIVSRPLDRSDLPASRNSWSVMWVSGTGRLCGVSMYPSGLANSFCYTDQATQLALAPGRAMSLNFTGDKGLLEAHALVRQDIATVSASSAVTPEQIATVVRLALPNGTAIGVFALTLYARDVSLGEITWIFRDTHGDVVATEVTDEWGLMTAP